MLDPQIVETGIAVILTGSLCYLIHVTRVGVLRSNLAHYKEQLRLTSEDYSGLAKDYGEAVSAHAAIADKHNTLLDRIESAITLIDSIPHRKGNETLIKAKLKGEA